MPAIATFPTFLRFPLGGARELLDRVLRAGGQMNHLGGGASMEALAAQVVAANWWESGGATGCVAAYQPKGAASLAASYLRIAGAGGNANLDPAVVGTGVAPTFGASGWIHNGSTQFLDSGVVVGNGWTMLVQFSGADATGNHIIAASETGSGTRFYVSNAFEAGGAGSLRYGLGDNVTVTSPTMAAGNLGIAGVKGFRNGVAEGTAKTWSGTNTVSVNIGRYSGNAFYFSGNVAAIVFYNVTLSDAQMLAVATAMAAL